MLLRGPVRELAMRDGCLKQRLATSGGDAAKTQAIEWPGRRGECRGPLGASLRLYYSHHHRGRSSVVARRLRELHSVGSSPIVVLRTPVEPIISSSMDFTFLEWPTENELGTAWVIVCRGGQSVRLQMS